ncbi:hypothetical protein NEPAR04_0725 [Nematocida parisii]|nr:hypothetical protein NEPAR03_2424 [Nematocida parisii]KAI5141154.1 hypothetical protein NEPAR04_0725 [Nematocida parisii]
MVEENAKQPKFPKNKFVVDEYAVGINFCKHNKEVFVGDLPKDHPCRKEGNIFEEMSTYFVLPLIRDAFLWIFEFIRNLIHVGYMEVMYIITFLFYLNTYKVYSTQFHNSRLFMTIICDCIMYFPLIIAQVCHTSRNSGSQMQSVAYIIFAYAIVALPRGFLIFIENIKNALWSINVNTVGGTKVFYGIASVYSVFYGLTIALVIYMHENSFAVNWFKKKISDLYLRECAAGLVAFSIIRAMFLYTECLLDNNPYKKKNALSSEEEAARLRRTLFIAMVYMAVVIGSVSFIYTYYSIGRAARDTSIVEDIDTINFMASRIMCDPVALVAKIAKNTFSDFWVEVKTIFSEIVDTFEKASSFIDLSYIYNPYAAM